MTAIQKEKGPAEAATSPDHGSIIPAKETKMNSTIFSSSGETIPVPAGETSPNGKHAGDKPMSLPSLSSHKISDVEDILASVRFLNEAVFMAAGSIGDRDQMNAIQAVNDEIENKLLVARDRLDEIREDLA
jgi:hypothetical protein